MLRFAAILAAVAAVGCGKKGDDRPADEPATAVAKEASPPSPLGDARVRRLQKCWAALDARDAAGHAACFRDDAITAFVDADPAMRATGGHGAAALHQQLVDGLPDLRHDLGLILVAGDQAVLTFAAHGTHRGPLLGAPATGNGIGLLGAQHLRLAGDRIGGLDVYVDLGSMRGQLGMLPPDAPYRAAVQRGGLGQTRVAVARADEAEKSNLHVVEQLEAAFSAGDADAAIAPFAEDGRFVYVPGPSDAQGKPGVAKALAAWMAVDRGTRPTVQWKLAAADYVAIGSEAGGLRELHLYQLDAGAVTELWVFAGRNPGISRMAKPAPARPAP